MAQRYHNPFAGIDLLAPVDQRNTYDRSCQTGGRTIVDQSPFARMVDLWFAGLSIAARRNLPATNLSEQQTFKFIDGSIFDRDSWRVQAVMLVAIAVEDNIEIVAEPRRMMTIANGLAAAGVPQIEEMLLDGDQEPIWNLSEALDRFFREQERAARQDTLPRS